MSKIERILVDYFEGAGADVEEEDAEWFVYINDGSGKVSLTGLAIALSPSHRPGEAQ